MRVLAYHSSIPRDPNVYHVYRDCPVGRQVPRTNWRSGTNRWEQCETCAARDAERGIIATAADAVRDLAPQLAVA